MRRDLENEADLLRDFIYVIQRAYPQADQELDALLRMGRPSTELCLNHRLSCVEEILKGYYRAVREKARGQTSRTYFRQGAVDET